MCFIHLGHGDAPPYKCCCGCSLLCGVILVFIMEVLSLWGAIMWLDIVGIVVSGILTGMFLLAICKRHSSGVRYGIFCVYLGRALIFAVNMAYYCISQSSTEIISKICNGFNKQYSWNECTDDISGAYWWIVISYILVVLIFRLLLARMLYYFYKE